MAENKEPKEQKIQGLQTEFKQLEINKDQQPKQNQSDSVLFEQPKYVFGLRKILKPVSTEFNLTWIKGPKAPTKMAIGTSAVIGSIAYFNTVFNRTRNIHPFDCKTLQWLSPFKSPYLDSTLTNIENHLTTVGGVEPKTFTKLKKLCTFSDTGTWDEIYPPMAYQRMSPAVISTDSYVVVIGGWFGAHIDSVEVLQLSNNQWSPLCPLPYGISNGTAVVCDNNIYILGGDSSSQIKNSTYSIFRANFKELIALKPSSSESSKVWQNIFQLPGPLRASTCVAIQDKLLAIGGRDEQKKVSSTVYNYDVEWCYKSRMIMARSHCLAAVCQDLNLLVIVGGFTDSGKNDETEIAKIELK